MNIALPLLLILIFVIIELCVMKFVRHEEVPLNEVVFNVNSGHIIMWLFRGVEIYLFDFTLKHFSLNWVSQWPVVWQWVFAFIAWDFCFYWLHRLHHKYALLWAVHVVHHQGEHFNISLGLRNSWYSSLASIPFFTILAILGLPVMLFFVVSSVHYTIQLYNHTSLVKHSGFLENWFVTPAYHRVHHGSNAPYVDKNFGGTLLIWDKLFGTFQAKIDSVPIQYGVVKKSFVNNPFWASNLPFLNSYKNKIFSYKQQTQTTSSLLIASGGLIIFGYFLYYIQFYSSWHLTQQALIFSLIVTGTIGLGAMADNKNWGSVVWCLLSLFLPIVLVVYCQQINVLAVILSILAVMHGASSVYYFKKRLAKIVF